MRAHFPRHRVGALLVTALLVGCGGGGATPTAPPVVPTVAPSVAAPSVAAPTAQASEAAPTLAATPAETLAASEAPTAPVTSEAPTNPPASAPPPATIDLWLGGILTTATAGTPYETWINHVITRFKAANPGSDVKITLLPSNNDQLAAQVQAAFSSKKVPDVMMLYSGAYTTVYADGLRRLNDLVDATPGFYDSLSQWDGSCMNVDCQGGQGEIVGVPVDAFLFVQWYRKDLLSQAGISAPATNWAEMMTQCGTLRDAGIQPWTYGDKDGYTTSNMMTTEITSFFDPGDVQKVLSGDLKYTDQKFVDAFNAIAQLKTSKCVPADASTREQIDASNDLVTGKAAYMEGYPGFLPYFDKVKDKIGVSLIPYAGTGPLSTKNSAFSNNDWVIPKDAAHPDLAWAFIKLASDQEAQTEVIDLLGEPPANKAAAAGITNPTVKYIADQVQNYGMPVLDSVMPNAAALVWYRELQQAFAGKITIDAALTAVQQAQDQQGP
jgi:ABC-type glycerol-3-phosphate transport system substrate-binding protein